VHAAEQETPGGELETDPFPLPNGLTVNVLRGSFSTRPNVKNVGWLLEAVPVALSSLSV
jgi:hypothetical protein